MDMGDLRYIRVCEDFGEELIELPVETDDTVLLTTLTAQFLKATGLKYKAQDSDCLRGVRLADGRLYPPMGGWESYEFCYNKRKSDEEERFNAKSKRLEGKKTTDLIVLSLAWRTDEEALKKYFSRYGDIVMAQVNFSHLLCLLF
ncbi:unnamed protein product [Protopolystoma xenopodis]|uniref:TAR DNA-binding protein 43 N-terminal domain-containing protein n=1 Tax=Protopolystoma xenopodis TaxID=117903 RepID=A0A3S5A6X1_9PLAT|nr:unnamed protein product [Protopolystoma xenopodis]